MMKQLSAVFSGQQALTMVEANEQAQQWFSWLGEQVASLDYHDATVAGRKIQQLMEVGAVHAMAISPSPRGAMAVF